jgi:hypothetical protein
MAINGFRYEDPQHSAGFRMIPQESAPIHTNPQASIRTFCGLVRVGADSRGMVRNGAEWCGMAINRFGYEDPHQSAGFRRDPHQSARIRTSLHKTASTNPHLPRISAGSDADSSGMVRNGAEWLLIGPDTRIRINLQNSAVIHTNPQEFAPVRTKPQAPICAFRGLMRIVADSCGMVWNGAEWPSMASDTRMHSSPQDSA